MKVIHNRLIKNNDSDTYHTYISIYIYIYDISTHTYSSPAPFQPIY